VRVVFSSLNPAAGYTLPNYDPVMNAKYQLFVALSTRDDKNAGLTSKKQDGFHNLELRPVGILFNFDYASGAPVKSVCSSLDPANA